MMIDAIALLCQIDENKAVVSKDDKTDVLEINFDDESDDDHNDREFFDFKMTKNINLHLDEHIIFFVIE